MTAHFILYVEDQHASEEYWSAALNVRPRLSVPGMTEFDIAEGVIVGLMPASGIKCLLGEELPDPATASRVPRSEVYLVVPAAEPAHARAVLAGGTELSPVDTRPWGHRAGYVLTPDGHVLAFAEMLESPASAT